jgi:hypothetical protein
MSFYQVYGRKLIIVLLVIIFLMTMLFALIARNGFVSRAQGATVQPAVTQPVAGPQILYQDYLRKLIRVEDGVWGTCYLLIGDRIGDSALSCVH